MSYGMLLLRLVLGGIMAAHGAQKLFGWWEGPGLTGTAAMTERMGFLVPGLMGILLALSELGTGLLLAAGLLTPLAVAGVVAVMVSAVRLVHWKNGFFIGKGGFEFNLLIVAAALAVAAIGPLRFSLDRALGWDDRISGPWWTLGALGAGAAASMLALTVGRRRPAPSG